ncbi:hypothetical protein N7466_008155 [Penicillium verhagenii]|uniref:uncharacterized protein n=1 Tax=Penicillium verhagenii TaxID=1562060 RepID=UPI0025454D1F|nr:uncharacterized protein N7466_008155 [Penicillium verhagenii]KAJ5923968.1 hypothetical protein N7466_008155 [Penicillium verhagenii]
MDIDTPGELRCCSLAWISYNARKTPLIAGFIFILLATILFVCARDPWVLVLARVCQGFSGAVVGVLGLSMIAETASPENSRAHMACGSAALTWGMLCGPMAGGFLFAKFGNVGAFGAPIVLLVGDIILRLLIVDKSEDDSDRSFEPCCDFDPSEEPLLLDSDSHGSSLSLYNFLHPTFLGVMFSVLAVSCILSAYETTLPLFVMDTYHWSSLGAGFIFLPLTVPAILSILVVHYTRHCKPRNIVMTGFFLMVLPMATLRWTQVNSVKHESLLVSMLFIIGLCITTVQAITIGNIPNAVQRIVSLYGITEKGSGEGRGYAFCNMAFAGGQAVGPVLGGIVKQKLGWSSMTLVLGGLCLVAGVISFFSISADPNLIDEEED